MANKKNDPDPLLETVQSLLIVQLALAGVDNHSIRKIAVVQMGKVTRILKVLKTYTKKQKNRRQGNG